jgi:hypothetical protein
MLQRVEKSLLLLYGRRNIVQRTEQYNLAEIKCKNEKSARVN